MQPETEAAAQHVLISAAAMGGERNIIDNVTLADPAPSDQELAMRRLADLMARVSDSAVSDLRQLRDDVDSTIRAIQAKHDELSADFAHHVKCVEDSVRFRRIASEHLTTVRGRFALPTTQRITNGT